MTRIDWLMLMLMLMVFSHRSRFRASSLPSKGFPRFTLFLSHVPSLSLALC